MVSDGVHTFGEFNEYIEYLVYRNLSNEHDGYLDHCEDCLRAAIAYNIRFDYARIWQWESDFIKYIMSLKNDPTRAIFPSLGSLIDDNSMSLVKDNEVERDYAELVLQVKDGKGPDMTCDLANDILLYSYKQRCLDAILGKNDTWTILFEIADPNTFAKNVRRAFDIFVAQVEESAKELSQSDTLQKPFSNLAMSQNEKDALIQLVTLFNRVDLKTDYALVARPSLSIYLADFYMMPGLEKAMGNNQSLMDNCFVQSTDQTDRIVKLYLEFGYALNDYRYFEEYHHFFERWYKEVYLNRHFRYHQPFIDQRFLTQRKQGESLADMFLRQRQQDAARCNRGAAEDAQTANDEN